MPELPEVETVRRSLKQHLLNRTIKSVEVLYPRMILTPLDKFISSLQNTKIIDVLRKGKFLIFLFDNHKALISHLRMEGKYYYFSEKEDNSSHARVIFHLDQNEKVIYDDTRKFGIMELHNDNDYLNAECLKKLGPEPFDMTGEELFNKLHHLNSEIKSVILNQTIIAGIGNIYADETLFASKINPFKPANKITKSECEKIILESRRILLKSIEEGGSTVSSYHPENGVDGKFQHLLNAYGRANKPCINCKKTMLKDFIGGRGTIYCPDCQKVCIAVGLYGKIASGKTTILKYYQKLGYPTFSSDEYINKLYSISEVKLDMVNLFSSAVLQDNMVIDKGYIKNVINTNPDKRLALENYFFPKVKKAIREFILSHKEDKIVFIEVPLMFESKIDPMIDYIIGVDISYPNQLTNLINRGSKTPARDLSLNQTNKFDKYITKCDFVIHNNSSLEDLENEALKTLNNIINN